MRQSGCHLGGKKRLQGSNGVIYVSPISSKTLRGASASCRGRKETFIVVKLLVSFCITNTPQNCT